MPEIDYAALAAKHGAAPSVDYAALAAKHGAVGAPDMTHPAGLPPGFSLPDIPKPAVSMEPKLSMGDLSDTASNMGTHLKNIVAGPYHALTDAPKDAREKSEMGSDGVLGHIGLAGARMLVNPTLDSGSKAIDSFKAGNYTDAAANAMDAVPIAGPMVHGYADDVVNKGVIPALGGAAVDFGVPEAGAGILGKIRAAAPGLAEGAMRIRPTQRGFDKTPGRAILDETSGVRPETITSQGQDVLDDLNPKIDAMAANHTGTVDITPARQVVADAIDKTKTRNSKITGDALTPIQEQLSTNLDNGLPLAANQTATGALNLKRGLRDSFVKNWNPDAASVASRDTARSASGVLDDSLDSALGPEFANTNQRISSLIPVVDAGEKLSNADSLAARFAGKMKAHTGSLTSAIGGAVAGAHSGGMLGAIGGGALGFALPELLGGPTSTMVMARAMDSHIPQLAARPLLAGGLLPRKDLQ